MSPQASARPHPRNRLPRLPLPAPLDGHTWPTVPSLLAAYLALLGALDREAQQPFCYAPSRLWQVGVRDLVMDICCALHTAGFGFPLGTRWFNRDKLNGLAVSGKEYVWRGWQQQQVKTILAALPPDGWPRLSAGAGTKGLRWYEWCWVPLAHPMHPAWRRWLLVRRSMSEPTDLTAYVVFAPHGSALEEGVRVAGSRWTVESCFEAAKGEVGLDHYEVRSWTGRYRHITLAMWA